MYKSAKRWIVDCGLAYVAPSKPMWSTRVCRLPWPPSFDEDVQSPAFIVIPP